jgi:hypothetical protein
MNAPFFVMLFTCGFWNCEVKLTVPYIEQAACERIVDAFRDSSSQYALCFKRETGEVLRDSRKKDK